MNMPLFANLGTIETTVPATPALADLRQRPHWSYSSIDGLVNRCSLAWAFRYVYKAEPEFRPASLVFGSAFHGALAFHAARRMRGKDCMASDCHEVFADLLATNCRSDGPPVRFGGQEDADVLIQQGQAMLDAYLSSLDPEEEITDVSVPFSVPLVDANGTALDKPLIGEYDLVVHGPDGIRTIVDWKTSARRWAEGKAATDLQPTCYLWAERYQGRADTQFRFNVVTKTRTPACEQHHANREPGDFVRLGELVRVLERVVAHECFLPRDGGWECANCPYGTACKRWHKAKVKTFTTIGRLEAA